jgi:hypothetical protein
MTLCDAEICGSCPLAADLPCCLRRKAQFCRLVARRRSARAIRTALQTMASQLIKEAAALEREAIALGKAR